MNEVLHANVFFFITSIAVIVFTAFGCVALVHGIKLLKSLRRIVAHVEESTEAVHTHVKDLRACVSEGGLIGLVKSVLFGTTSIKGSYRADTASKTAVKKKQQRTASKNALYIKDES